eukprot:NODE_9224_length_654_cov_94.037665_g8958_i0.p1 GENE.NODE_9224_length_654_cov_94.037665_g8958_i0~~NODE_9224_length_654_cov_94.037665_g8958_i0.p1  ORF type:complete len:189 (-),score=28.58 NODE_9224_length_654_cov_94.037665_g8958_i0:88-582(-)
MPPRPDEISNEELKKRLHLKQRRMQLEGTWPGTEFVEEAEVINGYYKRTLWRGLLYTSPVIAAACFFRWQLGPMTLLRHSNHIAGLMGFGTTGLVVARTHETEAIFPQLSKTSRSLLCEELCPHYLARPEEYKRMVYSSTFGACEEYCRTHPKKEEAEKSTKWL